jgi:anti-sigma B factor antagonist
MAELDAHGGARLFIETEDRPSGLVITLTGDLDLSNAPDLEAVLDRVLPVPPGIRPGRLVFDLGGLRFMDSSGIALLLRSASRVTAVSVERPSDIVRRLLEATGLVEVLHVEP